MMKTYHSVLAVQMKNWDPLLLGPALAMDKMPTEEYLNESKIAFTHISFSTMTKTCCERDLANWPCALCCHLVVKAKNIIFYLHKHEDVHRFSQWEDFYASMN